MSLPHSTSMPGPYDVFIPAFQGKQSANLIVSYARDPEKFPVNSLVTRTPTQLLSGNWLQLRPEALARLYTNPNSIIWVDGQSFPPGIHNAQDFRAVPYRCERRAIPDGLGWLTRDQAVWPIMETKLQNLAHLMMTYRVRTFYDLTLNASNHLSTHVNTATGWSSIGGPGGYWSAGTGTNPIIKRTLGNVADRIRRSTLNAVSLRDLTLVISPATAIAIGASQEIHWYLGQSPFAREQIQGDKSFNSEWSLPNKLYGMNLVVDGTLQTTSSRMVIPGTTSNILDDNTALVLAAPGALKSNVGQTNSQFSSVHMFVYKGEEMVVKTHDDPWNQRTMLGIYETYDMEIVAPETCALITNLFS